MVVMIQEGMVGCGLGGLDGGEEDSEYMLMAEPVAFAGRRGGVCM